MQVARSASILVALRLALSAAMTGRVDAPPRHLPHVSQLRGGTQGRGEMTIAPACASTSTLTSASTSAPPPPSAPFSPVQVRRVRYTHRVGDSQRQ
jgi:hypothetical protein